MTFTCSGSFDITMLTSVMDDVYDDGLCNGFMILKCGFNKKRPQFEKKNNLFAIFLP